MNREPVTFPVQSPVRFLKHCYDEEIEDIPNTIEIIDDEEIEIIDNEEISSSTDIMDDEEIEDISDSIEIIDDEEIEIIGHEEFP